MSKDVTYAMWGFVLGVVSSVAANWIYDTYLGGSNAA